MSRDVLLRNVFRGAADSPQSGDCFSPVTSLVQSLHASSLSHTPCKRLSLSSSVSDASDLHHDLSMHSTSLQDTSFGKNEITKGSINSPCHTPSRQCSPIDKENIPTPYYSPTHRQPSKAPSPLRDVQNIIHKSLTFSPLKKLISPSKGEYSSPVKKVSPPEKCDSNSRDSGYSESSQKSDGFVVPNVGCPSRKLNLDMSPPKVTLPLERRTFRSISSLTSNEDEDAFLMETLSICEKSNKSQDEEASRTLGSLLSAPIQCDPSDLTPRLTPYGSRLPIRRCLSMVDTTTPLSSRVRSLKDIAKQTPPFASQNSAKSSPSTNSFPFKRPQPPMELSSPFENKRRRLESFSPNILSPKNGICRTGERLPLSHRQMSAPETEDQPKLKILRSHSESHLSIMRALNKSSHHNELTGDFSREMALPTVTGGKHPDLKCINIHTMAGLLRGDFKDKIDSFSVLDCRYPYEYEGGHIKTASNWHTPQLALDYLNNQVNPPKVSEEKAPRRIYIFHCEFSAERAPKIQRLLRETDRQNNKEHYPALHFPEIYLLDGGYKSFYESYPELCTPSEYIRMLDENHTDDLKHFRAKSKSWAAEQGGVRGARIPVARTGRKKLGL